MDVVHRVSPKHSDKQHEKKRDSINTVLKTQDLLQTTRESLFGHDEAHIGWCMMQYSTGY